MRSLKIMMASLVAATTALGHAEALDRQTKFVSVAAQQVINEVRVQNLFYYEKCAFVHRAGQVIADELAAQAFSNCEPIGASQPLSAKPHLQAKLTDALNGRRSELADPSALRWAVNGMVQGYIIGAFTVAVAGRFLTPLYRRPVTTRDALDMGALIGTALGWTQAKRAISRRGANREVLSVLGTEMPTTTFVMDPGSSTPAAQTAAMDNLRTIIAQVMTAYAP